MRPKSIVQFEILFFVMLAGSFVMLALTWDETIARFAMTPGAEDLGESFPVIVLTASMAVGTAINLLLWFFIARKGSAVAKWIYVAIFLLALFGVLTNLASVGLPAGVQGVLTVAFTAIHAVAVWLLFRPDAHAWFRKQPAGSPE